MQLKTVGQSLNALNSIQNILNDTSLAGTRLNLALANSLSTYSIETVKAAIAQGTFTAEQIKAILTAKGLTDAEIQEVITTNALTASQTGATASTFGLGTAFKGLGLSIKTATKAMIAWMATNPIGWIAAVVSAIGAFIYGVVKLHDALTVSLEEQKEKLQETKEAYESVKNELQEVETELENTQNKVEELENTPNLTWVEQEELNRLREVTKELELQKQLKQDAQLESAEDLYKENEKTFNKEFKSSYGNTSIADMKEQLAYGHIGTGQLDYENITDIVSALQYINEEKAKLTDENQIAEYENFVNDLTELVKAEGQEYLSSLSEYKQNILEIASIRDLTEDEQEFYDYLSSMQKAIYEYYSPATWNSLEFDSVFDTEGIEKTKEELIAMYKSGELSSADMLEQFPKLNQAIKESEIITGEDSNAFKEFFNEIAALADGTADTVNDLLGETKVSSTITSSIEQIATQLEPQFAKLGDAYKDIFTADGFTLEAVDNSMLEDLRKSFAEIEDEIGVTYDAAQLEDFFAVLSNSNSTAEQTQEAFNKIATSYLYSTDVLESLNNTTVDSITKQLEALGIVNASEVATEALAVKEEYLAFARREHVDAAGNLVNVTQDLANATADDINVLIAEQDALEGEGIALDEATQKMIAYWMQKQAANGQLSTIGDIQQLGALCEALGVSSKALRNYIYFKQLASMTDVYDAASIERFSANAEKNMEQAQADIQSIYGKLGGAEINFADTSKKSGSSSKSEKDTTKEFDWIEQAIENVEKEVKSLDDVVNSAYSTFSQKNEALAKEIGKVNEEIELQQQAYDEYMRKADSIGLSEDYKILIHDGAINIENISDKNLQEKISEYQQWYDKAIDASDAISELSTKVKDLHVAGYELQADRIGELLDNESITEKQYLSEMKRLYKEYYENQVGYAQKAHEAKLALLDREKQYLNSVANAATSLLDKEISKIQDNAKEQQKPYEDQIKAAEKQIDAYEDQIKVFEKQIDAHNKQIDAYNKEIDLINDRKKPLQDELDALEDKAREENLILDLQEKQYNLKKAENQRDKLLYKDGQMIHTTDSTAIRDAKKEVEDAKLEIQKNDIQKQIDALDDEIEKYNELIDAINDQIDAIDDQIDAVNDQIDSVNDYIDGLNDIVDQINDAADAQVDALEKTKNKWQEVIDQQEEAQNMLLLTGEFGADAIRKILTGNDDDLLAQWKESYITTLSEIDSETQGYIGDMTDQLAGLYNVDLTPLQAQFDSVKESVNGVNNSLGSDEDSLTEAFTQVGNTANEVIGASDAEGDGTVIGELGSMKTAVNNVSDALSAGDESLENAILDETETAIDAFDQHTEKLTNEVIPAIQLATNEMNTFNETADRDIEKTITIKYQTVGSPASNVATGKAHAEGTVTGIAFANGNDGLKYHEKNALRSEYGQPELTVYPDGNYEITDTPTISDLPKGTVIYNEEQTKKIMSEKPKVSGNAHADGTVDDNSIVLPDGQILIRVPDDSPLFDMRRKADAYIEKFGGTLEDILKPVNAIQHHFDEIEKMVDNSIHNNIINNTNNQPNIVLNGGINITCPGVKDPEVMRNLHRLIEDEFVGLKTYAYQQVMRTR